MPSPRIVVDAMGGDFAPREVVAGAVDAARDLGLTVCLAGPTGVVTAEVTRCTGSASLPATLSIIEAPESIDMGEAPLSALRRKPLASIKVAAQMVARGEADALYSAGHTGATLLAAHAAMGVLKGADRPALAVLVPTRTGSAVLLDTGATVDCRAEHLLQFAVMGAAYARIALGLSSPRVGLLSIGEEAGKGTGLVREAHGLLAASTLNFVGNVEARDLFTGGADVIVCDGFTGNIALKVGEGLVETMEALLKEELGRDWVARVGAMLARGAVRRFKRRVDADEHGGAPLLGVGGLTLVGHGRSKARAIRNGIATAARLAEGRMVERLREALRP